MHQLERGRRRRAVAVAVVVVVIVVTVFLDGRASCAGAGDTASDPPQIGCAASSGTRTCACTCTSTSTSSAAGLRHRHIAGVTRHREARVHRRARLRQFGRGRSDRRRRAAREFDSNRLLALRRFLEEVFDQHGFTRAFDDQVLTVCAAARLRAHRRSTGRRIDDLQPLAMFQAQDGSTRHVLLFDEFSAASSIAYRELHMYSP